MTNGSDEVLAGLKKIDGRLGIIENRLKVIEVAQHNNSQGITAIQSIVTAMAQESLKVRILD